MKITTQLLALPLVLALGACASSSSSPTPTPEQGKGLEGPGASVEGAKDVNPEGVAYPTENLGTNARIGTTRGNTIRNFKFVGYPDGDISKGLQPVSLADYYDPEGKRYEVLHIQASGAWCPPCRAETELLAGMKEKVVAKRVVWIMSLAEGAAPGTPSTQGDLDKWIATFKAPYMHVLDPANKNLGPFYDAAALPWNANINARTMEILTTGVGTNPQEAAVLKELDEALELARDSKFL